MNLNRETFINSGKIIVIARLFGFADNKQLPNSLITTPPINLIDDKYNYTIESLSVKKWEELWIHDRYSYVPINPLSAMSEDEWKDQYDRLSLNTMKQWPGLKL